MLHKTVNLAAVRGAGAVHAEGDGHRVAELFVLWRRRVSGSAGESSAHVPGTAMKPLYFLLRRPGHHVFAPVVDAHVHTA